MSKHVIDDARRCLQCKTPLCTRGCPVQTPIRQGIQLLLESRIEEAGRLFFDNNPLSLVCSRVCPQENQCEGHCILNKKGSPVQISAIEQYISDYYLNVYEPKPSDGSSGKIAIIGSGPAGITIAILLATKNYAVTLYEGTDRIGGVLRYGIPEFRLSKTILDRMMDTMLKMGIKIRPNTSIGTNLSVDDLFRDGFKAVFMGTGVWRPNPLGIVGESLGHVHYAIEYLRNPDVYRLGSRIAVIGSGNVAMDVARTAIRHRASEVYVICQGGEESVTARGVELEYAQIDGAKLIYNKLCQSFTEEGIMMADSRPKDQEDHLSYEAIPGTLSLFPVDSIIIAIGQGPRAVVVSSTTGIDVTNRGLVAVDDCGRTSRPGVFASGDVVTGAKTVVEAVKVSRRVAEAIDSYVQHEAEATQAWSAPCLDEFS